jgi:hypothetical protein
LLSHLVRRDPELDRDAPWKPVMPQPANLAEPWSRLRIDWWALEWLTNKEPWRLGQKPPSLKGDPPVPFAATGTALLILCVGVLLGWRGVRRRIV